MKDLLTRRNILIATGGVVVVAGGAYEATRLLGGHHGPSPYDDLLARLDDRDGSAGIGKAVLADADAFDAKSAAAKLRAKFERSTLAQLVAEDAAAGRLVEAHGWVLPESLAQLCALAAEAA